MKLFSYICQIKRAGIITKKKFERKCVLLTSEVFEVTQSKVLLKLSLPEAKSLFPSPGPELHPNKVLDPPYGTFPW